MALDFDIELEQGVTRFARSLAREITALLLARLGLGRTAARGRSVDDAGRGYAAPARGPRGAGGAKKSVAAVPTPGRRGKPRPEKPSIAATRSGTRRRRGS